jgi:hypothetical protein
VSAAGRSVLHARAMHGNAGAVMQLPGGAILHCPPALFVVCWMAASGGSLNSSWPAAKACRMHNSREAAVIRSRAAL